MIGGLGCLSDLKSLQHGLLIAYRAGDRNKVIRSFLCINHIRLGEQVLLSKN